MIYKQSKFICFMVLETGKFESTARASDEAFMLHHPPVEGGRARE
jgi:hypothetical protein